jgi:hypothetical protein
MMVAQVGSPFDERLSHHEARERHEDRITEIKKVFFLPAPFGFAQVMLRMPRGQNSYFGCGFAALVFS